MKTHFYFSALILLIFTVPSAFANEAFSLEQALRIAYSQNPRMIEARKEISASKGRWIQAEAPPDPEMGISVGGFKKTEEGSQKKKVDSVEVVQPLDPLAGGHRDTLVVTLRAEGFQGP